MKTISAGGVQNFVSLKFLRNCIFPLPPLNEQKRIVERVEQLIAYCDELEKKKTEREKVRVSLNGAVLEKLVDSGSEGEYRENLRCIEEQFDVLYENRENVAKLKQAILQLAVMGKLVPQDPEDEPASVLLEKIKQEKERLIKEGKIKEQSPLPPVKEEEKPFALPRGWEWVWLNEVCELITKGSSPKWQGINYTNEDKGILFITSENVGSFYLRLEKKKYVEKKFNEIEPRSILKKNDFLMNIVGASIGRTAIYELEATANINQAVCLIRVVGSMKHIVLKYLLLYFNNPYCISAMFDKQVDNARANLSMGNIAKFLIPIPPFNEQKRIVERVERLLGLCDRLREGLGDAERTGEKLFEALVQREFGACASL